MLIMSSNTTQSLGTAVRSCGSNMITQHSVYFWIKKKGFLYLFVTQKSWQLGIFWYLFLPETAGPSWADGWKGKGQFFFCQFDLFNSVALCFDVFSFIQLHSSHLKLLKADAIQILLTVISEFTE